MSVAVQPLVICAPGFGIQLALSLHAMDQVLQFPSRFQLYLSLPCCDDNAADSGEMDEGQRRESDQAHQTYPKKRRKKAF